MFIPKTVIQAFRKFANAFLDRPIRKLTSDIGIHATANGCTLQVSDAGKSISCSVACKDGDEPFAESVILDLNGHVAVVGKSNQGTSCTVCLELDRSLHLGPDLRTGTPRHNLAYAAKIGADSLFLYGKDKPILACGPRMQYVWMPLRNQDLTVDLAQTQCVRTSTVAASSKSRRAS